MFLKDSDSMGMGAIQAPMTDILIILANTQNKRVVKGLTHYCGKKGDSISKFQVRILILNRMFMKIPCFLHTSLGTGN